ncbi:hypothetical protein [Acidimangrovimonas sediminis]|uniref:hypothetical protein n=1 Tax=Acidimangrovimonas sediminis TaxID=2056283 RepID=UPI000C802C44|nr:hypothetical protein [Acidimangrovimonas sediminis]
MVGASKILTVSYGTFSCTLEGFDDPFSTMKAIAEYFRDLAADDRYFGAEPPTPDAQMLHQIAEREIHRRVEAKIQENGVVLKAGETVAAAASVDEAPAPEVPAPPALAVPEAKAPDAVPDATPAPAGASVEPPEAEEEEKAPAAAASPVAATVPAPTQAEAAPEPDSVAAKLLRIRAAVAQAREGAARPAAAAAATSALAETGLQQPAAAPTAAPTAVPAFDDADDLPEDSDYTDDAPAVEISPALFEAAPEPAVEDIPAADVAASAEEAPVAASETTEAPAEMEIPAEAATDEGAPAEAAAATFAATEAEAPAAHEAEDLAEEPVTESPDAALPEVVAEAAPEPEAPAEETMAEAAPVQTTGSLEDTVSSFLGGLDAGEAPEMAPAAEAETEDKADNDVAAEDAAAEAEALAGAGMMAEPLARARARVIKVRRIDPAAATEGMAEDEDDAPDQAAMPNDEHAGADDTIEEPAAAETDEDTAEALPSIATREDAPVDAPVQDVAAETTDRAESEAEDAGALSKIAALQAEVAPEADKEEHLAEPEAEAQDSSAEIRAEGLGHAMYDDIDSVEDEIEDEGDDASSLSPEDEAELQAELAAVEREVEAHRRVDRPDRGGRLILEADTHATDDAMGRLMRRTEDQLEGAESRRRLATIAHLKAAVAAKEADRELGSDGDANHDDALRSYRDDLARVVRPRRPVSDGAVAERTARPADRPAPLVLVSAQRIDRPAETAPAAPAIRPRRVTAGSNLAIDDRHDEDEDEFDDADVLASSNSFTEFAERIGATDLPDLLEAAAAYTNCVEGREHFTRPQIMRFAAIAGRTVGAEEGDSFSREAGLRSFGMLLREGKIKKIKRGQFAISQSSRFIPEARKIAR